MKKFELNTKTMTLMAVFAALQVVLEFMTKFLPQMPKGGSVSFSLVIILLCSYLLSPIYALVVGMVCLGLHFALSMATFYGVLSLIFDYILPFVLLALVAYIPIIKIKGIEIYYGIVIVMILKTICHLISGWYAFNTPLAANLAYNLPYNIATLITCYILFVILYPRLKTIIK